jgi:hypothetical protein
MMRAKRLENVHTHKPPEGEQGENFHKTFSFLNFFFFLSGNLFLKKEKEEMCRLWIPHVLFIKHPAK